MNRPLRTLLYTLLIACCVGLLTMSAITQFPAQIIRNRNNTSNPLVTLATAACGDRFGETIVLIKSALVLSTGPIHFHLFTEDTLMKQFRETEVLSDVDALIYTDTDVLFLRPPLDIWNVFKNFSNEQVMAIARESELPNDGWYAGVKFPHVEPSGVNSGVLLVNLTRMREKNITNDIVNISIKYRGQLELGDQDILNILFHFYPERLYQMPCDINYHINHCYPTRFCDQAHKTGISVLHGNTLMFHKGADSVFTSVYNAFRDHRIGNDTQVHLLKRIKDSLTSAKNTSCLSISHIFTKYLEMKNAH